MAGILLEPDCPVKFQVKGRLVTYPLLGEVLNNPKPIEIY